MQRYRVIGVVGDGTYGSVSKAVNKKTNAVVAIKKMKKKFYSWEECVKLREVQSLKKLSHINIVKLKEVIRENDELFFVFEYVEKNVYQLMKEAKLGLKEASIRKYIYQILLGLEYTHNQGGYFHRDMKPENLLIGNEDVVKIADFGLARGIRSLGPYTDYVSTRWYRAPEVLLRDVKYNSPIDVWALGAIMAELYTNRPLFPGTSEPDQLYKVASVLGSPNAKDHPHTMGLTAKMNGNAGYKFPNFVATPLKQLIPNASPDAIRLIEWMLHYEPSRRPSATKAKEHPYFKDLDKDNVNESSSISIPKLGIEQPKKSQPMVNNFGNSGFGGSQGSSFAKSAVSLPSVGNSNSGRSASKNKHRVPMYSGSLAGPLANLGEDDFRTNGNGYKQPNKRKDRNSYGQRGSALKNSGANQFGSFANRQNGHH